MTIPIGVLALEIQGYKNQLLLEIQENPKDKSLKQELGFLVEKVKDLIELGQSKKINHIGLLNSAIFVSEGPSSIRSRMGAAIEGLFGAKSGRVSPIDSPVTSREGSPDVSPHESPVNTPRRKPGQ
jgi:hypothetical protein